MELHQTLVRLGLVAVGVGLIERENPGIVEGVLRVALSPRAELPPPPPLPPWFQAPIYDDSFGLGDDSFGLGAEPSITLPETVCEACALEYWNWGGALTKCPRCFPIPMKSRAGARISAGTEPRQLKPAPEVTASTKKKRGGGRTESDLSKAIRLYSADHPNAPIDEIAGETYRISFPKYAVTDRLMGAHRKKVYDAIRRLKRR
jgi:hypothetical protein